MTWRWPTCQALTWSSAAQPHRAARGIIVNNHTPVVQTGKESNNLGELVMTLDGDKTGGRFLSARPIDDTILGDRAIVDEIEILKRPVTKSVFASRGYSVDQPLAVAPQDLPNTSPTRRRHTLANLCTNAFRSATKADIASLPTE